MNNKISFFHRNIVTLVAVFSLLLLACLLFVVIIHYSDYKSSVKREQSSYIKTQQKKISERVNAEFSWIDSLIADIENDSREELKVKVDRAAATVQKAYNQKKLVKTSSLDSIDQFVRGDHISLVSGNGVACVFRDFKNYDKRSIVDIRDESGSFVYRKLLDSARRKGSGFVSSFWKSSKVTTAPVIKMVSYARYISGPDVFILGSTFPKENSKTAQSAILKRLAVIRFDGDEDIFVLDYDGNMLLNKNSLFQGKNVSDVRNKDGVFIIQKILEARKSDKGLYTVYDWQGTPEIRKGRRLTYTRCFDEWEWCLSSSVSIDEISEIKKAAGEKVNKRIFATASAMIIFFIIAIFLVGSYFYRLSQRTSDDLSMFIEFFKKSATEYSKIDRKKIKLQELDTLAIYANVMVDKIVEEKKELEKIGVTDHLTQVFNRNKLEEVLRREILYYDRFKTPASLVMFDIDHFKKINDTYGHSLGDKVLVGFAKLLKASIREIDIVIRWGGEEFIILLPRSTRRQATVIAEKIRKKVEAVVFPEVGTVTVSAGVSSLRLGDNSNTLIERADKALYSAKNEGRNCVRSE